jgi:hypothetical protein
LGRKAGDVDARRVQENFHLQTTTLASANNFLFAKDIFVQFCQKIFGFWQKCKWVTNDRLQKCRSQEELGAIAQNSPEVPTNSCGLFRLLSSATMSLTSSWLSDIETTVISDNVDCSGVNYFNIGLF